MRDDLMKNQGTFFFRVNFIPSGFYCECVVCVNYEWCTCMN